MTLSPTHQPGDFVEHVLCEAGQGKGLVLQIKTDGTVWQYDVAWSKDTNSSWCTEIELRSHKPTDSIGLKP